HEAWERYKDLLRACPHHGFTELHQLDTFYNSLNPADQDSLNAAAGGNFSEIAKLTHAVNQQTSDVTTTMTAMLKQLQSNPPPAQVKAIEEICVTCGGAHPYYMCLAAGGNTFLEFRDNIQGYVSTAAGNYNQGNPSYRPQGVANQMRPPGLGSLPGNTVANPKGELKAITTRSGLVTDGPTVLTHPKSVTPEEDECVEETYTDPDLAEYTIKVPPPPVQKPKPPIQRHFVLHTRDSPLLNIPELKCKALADLGASINLMPLSVWKKLGLPDLIPTRMTLELANYAICTPDGIARDVIVPVGKFTFPADFVIVDYESDPRVPLILGRPFLRTARALINVHGEEMILLNLINIFNVSSEDCLEVSVLNKQSGNPTFSFHKEITSLEVTHEIHDSEGCEDSDIKDSIDQPDLANLDAYFVDPTPEMFTDEHALNYSFPSRFDVYPDDFLEIESDADNFYDDPFDSKGEKIKEYGDLPSLDNEDKVINPGIIIHEKSVKIITRVAQEKKLATSYASLVFKDFDPPFYEPKDVPTSMRLLLFSSENKEKVFKPGIYTSEKVKENQEKDKIGSKPDKNEKRDEAGKVKSGYSQERKKNLRK
nr:reverse transcriptase domain-containing protein [Tanacetum cinerariifolium]